MNIIRENTQVIPHLSVKWQLLSTQRKHDMT